MKKIALFLSLVLLLAACKKDKKPDDTNLPTTEENTPKIPSEEIELGPLLRDTLSPDLEEKIVFVHGVFEEVNPSSLEKWKNDFKRDANPDKEIKIWIAMANAYEAYLKDKDLSLDEKKEVYEILLVRSVFPVEEALNSLNLLHLDENIAINPNIFTLN